MADILIWRPGMTSWNSNMYIYIHTYICICMYMYMYVCVRVYIHICILRCDLVHIDGGHFDFTPWNDLVELARASHDSTILVVDDTPSIGDVARAIREFLCFHICVLCRCMKLEFVNSLSWFYHTRCWRHAFHRRCIPRHLWVSLSSVSLYSFVINVFIIIVISIFVSIVISIFVIMVIIGINIFVIIVIRIFIIMVIIDFVIVVINFFVMLLSISLSLHHTRRRWYAFHSRCSPRHPWVSLFTFLCALSVYEVGICQFSSMILPYSLSTTHLPLQMHSTPFVSISV